MKYDENIYRLIFRLFDNVYDRYDFFIEPADECDKRPRNGSHTAAAVNSLDMIWIYLCQFCAHVRSGMNYVIVC